MREQRMYYTKKANLMQVAFAGKSKLDLCKVARMKKSMERVWTSGVACEIKRLFLFFLSFL
jgi:hypothetical protein